MKYEAPHVLVGTPHPEFGRQVTKQIKLVLHTASVACATTVDQLREMARDEAPEIIILDERVLAGASLTEPVAELAAVAPVVVVARYDRASEVARLIAAGQVEFVPHADHWVLLMATLAERRLRSAQNGKALLSVPNGLRADLGEVFRHEINNPLTGILGNAELLLAHSDRLAGPETQRIRTIVELAVRLREAVRRVSDTWEKVPDSKTHDLESPRFASSARASGPV